MPQDFAQITARQQIEDEIERLIGILDAMDGDTDLEPSLGLGGYPWCRSADGADLEGDGCDDEPSLGAPEGAVSQLCWGAGPLDDLEEQCDDEGEPNDNGIADMGGHYDVHARAASLGVRVS